jgi:hypothetical protein
MWRHRLALVGGSDSSPSESELEAELFDTPQRGPWEPTNHSPQPNGELSVPPRAADQAPTSVQSRT